MIQGWFEDAQPTIMARVLIPRLMVNAYATFLVNTGSDSSGIHPDPTVFAALPYAQLENPFVITGRAIAWSGSSGAVDGMLRQDSNQQREFPRLETPGGHSRHQWENVRRGLPTASPSLQIRLPPDHRRQAAPQMAQASGKDPPRRALPSTRKVVAKTRRIRRRPSWSAAFSCPRQATRRHTDGNTAAIQKAPQ